MAFLVFATDGLVPSTVNRSIRQRACHLVYTELWNGFHRQQPAASGPTSPYLDERDLSWRVVMRSAALDETAVARLPVLRFVMRSAALDETAVARLPVLRLRSALRGFGPQPPRPMVKRLETRD
jgi:hypothetical protein